MPDNGRSERGERERVSETETENRKLLPFSAGNQKEESGGKAKEKDTQLQRMGRVQKKYSTEVNQNHERRGISRRHEERERERKVQLNGIEGLLQKRDTTTGQEGEEGGETGEKRVRERERKIATITDSEDLLL